MDIIKFDLTKNDGAFKIMNATNGGPFHRRHTNKQYRSNFVDYKAARMQYTRNHDSAAHSIYGGPYSHDITCIFPQFGADPTDPASYDFACTDEAILTALEAGTKTFFRLGQTIEHQIKKHNTLPPKDFHKWAVICEHIIRHYTEGWADGFTHDMPYWEIWNEPDVDPDDSPNKRTWGGTKAEFFDLYEITAKHLKACFPHLKIGGPALAHREDWADDFLREMKARGVEIDFFSWHGYCSDPLHMADKAAKMRGLMDKHGYGNAESILNEWNYIKGWTDQFIYSIKAIHGVKGATFVMACMTVAQHSSIDMLMYYDTRPSSFNGAFDFYTYEPLHGYYPLYWYGMFYDMDHEVIADSSAKDIYTLCGVDKNGKSLTVVTYYSDDDNAPDRDVKIDMGRDGSYETYLLDEDSKGERVDTPTDLTFTMKRHSCLLIKEI